MNEYSSLKDGSLYSWADLGPGSFFLRLGGLWLLTFVVLGVPVAAASFNPAKVIIVLFMFYTSIYVYNKITNSKYMIKF